MTFLIFIAAAILVFFLVLIYCCAVAAGRADRELENMTEESFCPGHPQEPEQK